MVEKIETLEQLLAYDEQLDIEICGLSMADSEAAPQQEGVHAPDPTPYFVSEELFQNYTFTSSSHLLDVGCGMGRVLAYFKRAKFPGRATGVELDPTLAFKAGSWLQREPNLVVVRKNALELALGDYSDFCLFNPFDSAVLVRFLDSLEVEARRPITLIHMSDNGETYFYQGRSGWTLEKGGEFQYYQSETGAKIKVFDCPQHYSVWKYDPKQRVW